jgi:hypothetical protein
MNANTLIDHNNCKAPGKTRVLIAKYHLTDYQKQVIFGTLLGDGSLHLFFKERYHKLSLEQGSTQEDYLKWKTNVLGDFTSLKPIQYKNSTTWTSRSISHPDFTEFYHMFYNEGKKIVPLNLELLTPLAIAIWFADDGSQSKSSNQCWIFTCSFSLVDNERLCSFFKEVYQIEPVIRHWSGYPLLAFNKDASLKLHDLIDEYIPSCMSYKKIDDSSETVCEAPLIEDEDPVQTI